VKKGQKLLGNAYILQIKDIHNKTVGGGVCRSLRQAVMLAGEYVIDMDNYAKVYREFTLMRGAYAGVFFAKYNGRPSELALMGRKPSKHLFVLVNHTYLQPAEIQTGIEQGPPEGFLGELAEFMGE
jgi:hypothetical protein